MDHTQDSGRSYKNGKQRESAANEAVAIVCSPSTTYEYRRVRMPGRPKGQKAQSPQASALRRLSHRNMREPLTWTISYRGGSMGWIEIRARGITYRCPGDRQVLDVLRDLNRDW